MHVIWFVCRERYLQAEAEARGDGGAPAKQAASRD